MKITEQANSLEAGITNLIQGLEKDYEVYDKGRGRTKEFTTETGKKYVKVVTEGSAWGFVVINDTGKFKKGDILKASGWNAPAKNFRRGNVLEGNYIVKWYGACYIARP
jgi:hypothetical protein